MSCGRITRGSDAECDNLPESGTRARLILINYRDVESIEEDENGIITAINLIDGTFGYEFLGFRSDVQKIDGVVRTKKKNRFSHEVSFIVYELDQLQKNNIQRMARGRFLAIAENRGQDENSIEVLGKNVGMQLVGGVIRDAHENGGLFTLQLSSPQNGIEFETKLPQTLGYSYDEALIIIDNLLMQPPWILAEGDWNDSGSWFDTEYWIDG